jgi:hypothetical protein
MSSLNPKTYDTTPPMSVAFIGLGVMGYRMPFAKNLPPKSPSMHPPHAKPRKGPIWCFAVLAMTTICAR